MNKNQIEKLRKRLDEELEQLRDELSEIAQKDVGHKSNWSPVPDENEGSISESGDAAKREEEFLDRSAITHGLERRYHDVRLALKKIEKGEGYGICEISGETIEVERLEANPAARTNLANKDIDLPSRLD